MEEARKQEKAFGNILLLIAEIVCWIILVYFSIAGSYELIKNLQISHLLGLFLILVLTGAMIVTFQRVRKI